MNLLSIIIALIGLFLSILNSWTLARQRRKHIMVNRASCLIIKERLLLLECLISNRSSLPLSINAVKIQRRLVPVLENDSYGLLRGSFKRTRGIEVLSEREAYIPDVLPVSIEAYSSRRIVLQFHLDHKLCTFLRSLHDHPSRFLGLSIYTSRGRWSAYTRVSFPDVEEWLRHRQSLK